MNSMRTFDPGLAPWAGMNQAIGLKGISAIEKDAHM
jgi:hypothetical protein